jgi:hypothetical protein
VLFWDVTPCILVAQLRSGCGHSGRREADTDVSEDVSASIFSVEV